MAKSARVITCDSALLPDLSLAWHIMSLTLSRLLNLLIAQGCSVIMSNRSFTRIIRHL